MVLLLNSTNDNYKNIAVLKISMQVLWTKSLNHEITHTHTARGPVGIVDDVQYRILLCFQDKKSSRPKFPTILSLSSIVILLFPVMV